MNLHGLLKARAEAGDPVRVGLIGAGKFATMFLAQARSTPGLHIAAIAELDAARARRACANAEWPADATDAASLDAAIQSGATWVTEDAMALIADERIDVVVEATGNPAAGIAHALAAIAHGHHIVMVNVEADVLAGPLLAARARDAGVVYSLAYGDQPALICEQVDWARAAGFTVVCAGKGTKYRTHYHQSTPDTVWGYYGLSAEQAAAAGMNSKMFNSFLDGTKSAIEMAAVANACGLTPQSHGLEFPPCGVHDLARVCRPKEDGGHLSHAGTVEVVSCEERDGRPVVGDLRWGTYVTFAAPTDYAARCFAEYGLVTDDTGRYSALWRPYHLIGMELGISVASAALRREPTGAPAAWSGDVAATAKRDLATGEVLDGEGGYTVYGRLMPALDSLNTGALPLGLAHGVTLKRAIKAGDVIGWADVTVDDAAEAVRVRREMEHRFALKNAAD